MHCFMGAGSILLKLLTLSAGSDMLGSVHIQIQYQTISAQFQLHLSLQPMLHSASKVDWADVQLHAGCGDTAVMVTGRKHG